VPLEIEMPAMLPSSTVSAAWPADMPCSTSPAASIQAGTATIIPIHKAA